MVYLGTKNTLRLEKKTFWQLDSGNSGGTKFWL